MFSSYQFSKYSLRCKSQLIIPRPFDISVHLKFDQYSSLILLVLSFSLGKTSGGLTALWKAKNRGGEDGCRLFGRPPSHKRLHDHIKRVPAISPRLATRKAISQAADGGPWLDCDSWKAPGIVGFKRAEGRRSRTAMAAGQTEAKYERWNS